MKKFLDRKPPGQPLTGDVNQGGVGAGFWIARLAAKLGHDAIAISDHAWLPGPMMMSIVLMPDGGDQQDIVDKFLYAKDHWSHK